MVLDVDAIMVGTGPQRSAKAYDAKLEFERLCDSPALCEVDYTRFFDHLCGEKLAGSTIWSKCSMLNSVHEQKTGKRLQQWPHWTILLKSSSGRIWASTWYISLGRMLPKF